MSILLSESLIVEVVSEINKQIEALKSGNYSLILELTPCNANAYIEITSERRPLDNFENHNHFPKSDTYLHYSVELKDIDFTDDDCNLILVDESRKECFIASVNGKL